MESLLEGAADKEIKLKLTYGNIVSNQAVKNLSAADWVEILMFMTTNIYTYIDTETTEGQDILNQFFTEGQSWMLPDLFVQRKTTNRPI